jgi:hypothetical protein
MFDEEAEIIIKDGVLSNANDPPVYPTLKTSFVETTFQNIEKRLKENGDVDVIVNGSLGITS